MTTRNPKAAAADEDDAANARHDLLVEVSCGALTPQEAEAEALRRGICPLATAPDPAMFDPHAARRWSMAMTVAWIVWRTDDRVRVQMPGWRSQTLHWAAHDGRLPNGVRRTGFHLEPGDRTSPLSELRFNAGADAYDAALMQCTIEDAFGELRGKLQDGALVAEGLRDGDPVDIPARDWEWLTHTPQSGRVDDWRMKSDPYPFPIRYSDIVLKRADVMRLWPAAPGSPSVADAPVNFRHEQIRAVFRRLPPHLGAKDRNHRIRAALGWRTGPSDSTIALALRDEPGFPARLNRRKARS